MSAVARSWCHRAVRARARGGAVLLDALVIRLLLLPAVLHLLGPRTWYFPSWLDRTQKIGARALFLTPQGRKLLKRAFGVAAEQEQLLTSKLTEEERGQLLELLARVGAHVGIPAGVHPGMGHSALPDQ